MRTCNFSAGISMQEVFSRILLPGSILSRILEQIFFLGGILVSTDVLAGFLPRCEVGIFPSKDPTGKTGHLGRILARARNPGTRILLPILQGWALACWASKTVKLLARQKNQLLRDNRTALFLSPTFCSIIALSRYLHLYSVT